MSNQDLEALVSPKIAEAVKSAVAKVGQGEFTTMTGIDDEMLGRILSVADLYVPVGLVTIACQINKSHDDPILEHSSVTECLKGTTIRIPPAQGPAVLQPRTIPYSAVRRGFQRNGTAAGSPNPYDAKAVRLLGFGINTIAFFILGYLLGGIGISPLIGQQSCVGVSLSSPWLVPCAGSLVGLVISAIGGMAYTYYYFVKRV